MRKKQDWREREKQALPGKINTDCLAERTRRTAEGCGQGILEGCALTGPGKLLMRSLVLSSICETDM